MNQSKNKYIYYRPIIFALILIAGMFIGTKLNFVSNSEAPFFTYSSRSSKIEELINYIEEQYVDTVEKDKLIEKTLSSLLQNLDPHSAYVSAEELRELNEPLKGNFDGIGIEFNTLNDTVRVVSVISGGPSETIGIQPGDRIVKVENTNVAGVKISNKDIVAKLRGKSGTKVSIGIKRNGSPKLINYTITRGKIPIYSVDAAYLINSRTGFIKINRFSATTFDEYKAAFHKLRAQGMENLILDLRNNPGGYLNAAVDLADEFLPEGKQIVYTTGKSHPKKIYTATAKGDFEKNKLIVLIDEGSASASEIIAGAVQDNDRGLIIGRRSFGKGLVQEQSDFSDGSAVRLTIARYYTPTGRCIQRPYNDGSEAYYHDEVERFEHGEFQFADSIRFVDSLKFMTPGGKIVYGGGGIMPDFFVPLDTSGRSAFLAEVIYKGIVNQFAYNYADRERQQLKKFGSFEAFNKSFSVDSRILNEFVTFAVKNGVKRNDEQLKRSERLIKTQIKALISRNIWGNNGYYFIVHASDKALQEALKHL